MDPGFLLIAAAGVGALWWRHLRGARRHGPPAVGDALDIAIHVASHEARVRGHGVEPLHLFYGLIQDDDVRTCASRLGADLDAIERKIFADLDGTLRSAASMREFSVKGAQVLERTVASALAGGRSAGLPDLLMSLIRLDPGAEKGCTAGGISALDLLVALVHGVEATTALAVEGPELAVVLVNDDFSTMELVTEILEKDFGLNHEAAIALMLRAHQLGHGEIGTFPAADAREKTGAATARARAHGAPLLVRLELPVSLCAT